MILNRWRGVLAAPEEGNTPTGGAEPPVEKPTEKPAEKPAEKPEVKPEVKTPVEVPSEQTPSEEATPKPPETDTPAEDKSKLGQVTNLVEQAGLTMKEVAEYAKANEGGVDLDTMVALKEKHGDAIASLIADQIKSIHKERSEAASKRDAEVFDQVAEAFKDVTEQSGEETWKELATWSKDNVSTEHRKEINALLSQGGLAAKLAVQELVSAFKEAQGNTEFQDADLLEADTTSQPGAGGDISKSDYTRELDALLKKGHVYGESAEISKLDARRAKTISRGR